MAGSRGPLDREVLTAREHPEDSGSPEWLFALDAPTQMACQSYCAGRAGSSPASSQPRGHGSLNIQNHQGQNCSLSCSCDADSGYELSPAYFVVENHFIYPPVEDLDEEELDDVFYDPPAFLSAPSTP